jgi:hypothetical protein
MLKMNIFVESFSEVTSEKRMLINAIPNQNDNRIDNVKYNIRVPREVKVRGSQLTNE